MKRQFERLIQTSIHSNPKIIIAGTTSDASGVITIDWSTSHNLIFTSEPIILAIYPIGVATGKTTQPICYHQEWIKDADGFYTGMKVYSEGVGTEIHWSVMGVAKR
jgi:hypothetical protein